MSIYKDNLRSILFDCCTLELSRSILFQSAMFWADQGLKVTYFTPKELQGIPTLLHGTSLPGPEVLKLLQFVYVCIYIYLKNMNLLTIIIGYYVITLPFVIIIILLKLGIWK
uniref:Uncharacterized protein n=1 Tax=Clastoptera arizonana TaxID=38151 RepID=A0A1B6D8T2_9HEMI